MIPGFGLGKPEGGNRQVRHYLGLVSLLLLITACLGIQVIAFLASTRGSQIITNVRVLSKSTADYSFDEILPLAPILPGILEDLERDSLLITPVITTPPAIGQVIPTITNTNLATVPGLITTVTPPVQPTMPTNVSTGIPTTDTTLVTTSPPTSIPTTPIPSITATTKTPTPVVTTPVPTTRVPTTPVPTTRVPTTQAPTTSVPTTQVPTTQVPTTQVPTTRIPPTVVPTTPVPTPIPPTITPTPTGIIELPTPIQTLTDEPTWVEETIPGNGLDVFSTPEPTIQLVPSLWSVLFARTGTEIRVCTVPTL